MSAPVDPRPECVARLVSAAYDAMIAVAKSDPSITPAEVLSATTTMLAYSIEYVEAQSHPEDREHNRQALMTALQTLLLRVTPSTPTM